MKVNGVDHVWGVCGDSGVYFAMSWGSDDTMGLVKIGYAEDIRTRVAGLKCDAELMHQIPCDTRELARVVESCLHWLYRHDRKHGEWFDLVEFWDDETGEPELPYSVADADDPFYVIDWFSSEYLQPTRWRGNHAGAGSETTTSGAEPDVGPGGEG